MREGTALCQGIIICGGCGGPMAADGSGAHLGALRAGVLPAARTPETAPEALERLMPQKTHLVSIAPDLEGKRLELLREVAPKLSVVSVLMNPANPFHALSEKQVRAAAGEDDCPPLPRQRDDARRELRERAGQAARRTRLDGIGH